MFRWRRPAGTEIGDSGTARCEETADVRYTAPDSIWEELLTGNVKLLRASYLSQLAREGGVLSHRQKLPPEAFMSVEELKHQYGHGSKSKSGAELGVLPIISISFCWTTVWHPDPNGEQLATVANALERKMPKMSKVFTEMGVFWDWASIYQKDPELFDKSAEDGGEKYQASRSKEEEEAFNGALKTMDLWYAHQGTTVYMLTKKTEGMQRPQGYDERGWTVYERRATEQCKKAYMDNVDWRLAQDLGAVGGTVKMNYRGPQVETQEQAENSGRKWPLDPDAFDAMIGDMSFSNLKDSGLVKKLFRDMSERQLRHVEVMDFSTMWAPTVQDMEQLGRCLSHCRRLKYLGLDQYRGHMTNEACVALFSNLAPDAHIEKINLQMNDFGAAIAEPIAAYLRSNCSIKMLDLRGNSGLAPVRSVIQAAVRGKNKKTADDYCDVTTTKDFEGLYISNG